MIFKSLSLFALSIATFPEGSYSIEKKSTLLSFGDAVTEFKIEGNSKRNAARNLQGAENCQIAANVQCTLLLDGSPCQKLRIPLEHCNSSIPITMTYEVCNNEKHKWLEFSPQLTQLKSFKKSVSFDKNLLPPETCRSRSYSRVVNSCEKGKIVGSFKVEGWNDEEKEGNYCFAWSFYKAKIRIPSGQGPVNTVDPTPSPTPSPTPRITSSPTHPCDDISFANFDQSNLQRNIMFRYIVNNESNEAIDVSELSVTRGNGQFFSFESFLVGPGSLGIREEVFFIDLAEFSDDQFKSEAEMKTIGVDSGVSGDASTDYVFHVPDFFATELQPSVQCVLETSDLSCQEYMSSLSLGDPECDANVIFRFRLKNTGLVCENIIQAESMIDGERPLPVSFSEPRNFCSDDILTVDQLYPVNLCNFFGEDITVAITLNSEPFHSLGESFISFPVENSMNELKNRQSWRI